MYKYSLLKHYTKKHSRHPTCCEFGISRVNFYPFWVYWWWNFMKGYIISNIISSGIYKVFCNEFYYKWAWVRFTSIKNHYQTQFNCKDKQDIFRGKWTIFKHGYYIIKRMALENVISKKDYLCQAPVIISMLIITPWFLFFFVSFSFSFSLRACKHALLDGPQNKNAGISEQEKEFVGQKQSPGRFGDFLDPIRGRPSRFSSFSIIPSREVFLPLVEFFLFFSFGCY